MLHVVNNSCKYEKVWENFSKKNWKNAADHCDNILKNLILAADCVISNSDSKGQEDQYNYKHETEFINGIMKMVWWFIIKSVK